MPGHVLRTASIAVPLTCLTICNRCSENYGLLAISTPITPDLADKQPAPPRKLKLQQHQLPRSGSDESSHLVDFLPDSGLELFSPHLHLFLRQNSLGDEEAPERINPLQVILR